MNFKMPDGIHKAVIETIAKRNEIKELFIKTFFAANEFKPSDITPELFNRFVLNEQNDFQTIKWWVSVKERRQFDVGKCEKFRDSETEAAWLKQIEVLEAWNAGTIEELLESWVENV